MRKHYFNDAETGFFKKVKRKVVPKNPMTGELLVLYSTISILINVTSLTLIDCSSRWLFDLLPPFQTPVWWQTWWRGTWRTCSQWFWLVDGSTGPSLASSQVLIKHLVSSPCYLHWHCYVNNCNLQMYRNYNLSALELFTFVKNEILIFTQPWAQSICCDAFSP